MRVQSPLKPRPERVELGVLIGVLFGHHRNISVRYLFNSGRSSSSSEYRSRSRALSKTLAQRSPLAGFLGRPPSHLENMLARAQMRGRVTVAIQTPFHRQGGGLARQGHRIDPPVAFLATNTGKNMNIVSKMDEFG